MDDSFNVRTNDYSDAGNATAFVREYHEDVIYTDSMGWICWDGERWERNEHRALELAEELSKRMLDETRALNREAMHTKAELEAAAAEGQKDEKALEEAKAAVVQATAYLNHAKTSRRAPRIKAVLELAGPFLFLPGAAMDANPCELNTQTSGDCWGARRGPSPVRLHHQEAGKYRPVYRGGKVQAAGNCQRQ